MLSEEGSLLGLGSPAQGGVSIVMSVVQQRIHESLVLLPSLQHT